MAENMAKTQVDETNTVAETTKKAPAKAKTTRKPATKKVKGVVSGCLGLRVRENPDLTANVVKVLKAGTEVTIEKSKSTEDFYKVEEGYCVKQYIALQ